MQTVSRVQAEAFRWTWNKAIERISKRVASGCWRTETLSKIRKLKQPYVSIELFEAIEANI